MCLLKMTEESKIQKAESSVFFKMCICVNSVPLYFQGGQAKLHSLSPAQKAYMSSLSQGLDTIGAAEKDLGSPAQIPALGSDPV